MNAIEAQNALIAHLQDMPGRPEIAYPNGQVVTDLPRMVVESPSASVRTATIGGRVAGVAQIMIRIETDTGNFTAEADDIAEAIIAHFPVTERIGGVTIIDPPAVQTTYRDGGVFYMPVLIRGTFYS